MDALGWTYVALGASIGWMLHSVYDAAWDAWVKPRLMAWLMRDFERPE